MPGSGVYIQATCSGGASGGIARFFIDIPNSVLGYGLLGQWVYIPSDFLTTATINVDYANLAETNRLSLDFNTTDQYMRRQLGWNLFQSYCSPTLTYPDWYIEAGVPTCLTTQEVVRFDLTLPIGGTGTLAFGDLMKQYTSKAQITVWAADGDNTAFTEMYAYMAPRGLVGSYLPTSLEIGQGVNPMPLATLRSMQAGGWSVHGHQSVSTVGNYTLLTPAQLSTEIALVKSTARQLGLYLGSVYQPPGSNTNVAVNQELVRQGFSGIVQGGNTSNDQNGRANYGGIVNPLLWNVNAESNTFAQNKAVIDHAMKYGESVSLLWHKVDGTVICQSACFRQTIDYLTLLRDANRLDVVTWEQLIGNQYKHTRN